MGILFFQTEVAGQVSQNPRRVKIVTTDNLATVTTAGYLNSIVSEGFSIYQTDFIDMVYSFNQSTNSGTNAVFTVSISVGIITLALAAQSNQIVTNNAAGQTITAPETSATPGTVRVLTGKITQSATTMTSGNIVGLRGEADMVGASGGFVYGTQGKVIPTGTLSGSVWVAGVFGQFDLSHPAVINGAQLAAIWGDWGATGGTATDLSGCRGIAFTNTTSNVLNAQDYRYGNATYLMELAGAGGTLNYYLAAGVGAGSAGDAAHCAAQKVIRIEINGVAAYIPVFTQNT